MLIFLISKYKSEDYKDTAVKYYLENNDTNYIKTCDILSFQKGV